MHQPVYQMPTAKSLSFQKSKFVDEFLEPVAKVTKLTSLIVNDTGITAICHNDDNVILFATNPNVKVVEASKLNFHEIDSFIRLLECIPDDNIELDVTSNALAYKSGKMKFKYHLAEDAMIPLTKINIQKINGISFNSKFFVDRSKVQEILKCSSITKDSNKIYFTVQKDIGVVAELTDLQTQQSDSVSVNIADEFEGEEIHTALPINLNVLRLITSIKFDKVLVKINTDLKVLMFELQVGDTSLKYIISSLVK